MEKLCSKCNESPRIKFKSGRVYAWCRNCTREKGRKTYAENGRKKLEQSKSWQRRNPGKVKESRRKTQWKLKNHIIGYYGGKCNCCGENEIRFLCIDHINNDGHKQREKGKYTGGTAGFYYWIKKNDYPKDLQVLCYNCNMAKAFYKICPHK